MKVHRIMLVVVAAAMLSLTLAVATATASAASKGSWKRAMVAANKELAKEDRDITVHRRLNFRNTWGFAARATAWRVHKAYGLQPSTRLTSRLKGKIRPYLPKASRSSARRWALKWERQARKNRRHAVKHARCFRKRLPRSLRSNAKRSRRASWSQYGRAKKREAYRLARYVRKTMRRMQNPRGSNVRRWLPLARHEGWPRSSERMLVKVIYRESKGNPRLRAGRYRGLLQIDTGHARGYNLYNPRTNLAIGRMLYKRLGWQPWASTAY